MSTETFDAATLDDRAQYERRVEIGRRAVELGENEPETSASDVISDVLTYLYGPAGVWRVGRGMDWKIDAQIKARDLIERAFRSWEGDSEDYTYDESESDAVRAGNALSWARTALDDPAAIHDFTGEQNVTYAIGKIDEALAILLPPETDETEREAERPRAAERRLSSSRSPRRLFRATR